jgi:peptidoglycan/LPS O-acetylase OafA/YrhL
VIEFRLVLEETGMAGLAASFLKPSSIALAIALSGLALVVPAGPLASRLVRRLAPASFAIYLVHGGVIQAVTRLLPEARSTAEAWLGVVVTVLAGLAAPILFHEIASRRLPGPFSLLLFGRAGAGRAPRGRAESDGAGRPPAAPGREAPSEAAPSWIAKAS